jgi:TonB-dependent SusC/RagA subfamily outer membrane receptor
MKDQDTLYNQIKAAAEQSEAPKFDAMESVWQRVEEKLEAGSLRKETALWKKIAVAASLLLLATLSYQFFVTEPVLVPSHGKISLEDTIQKTLPENNSVAVADTTHPALKKDAERLLQKQVRPQQQVAYEAVSGKANAKDEEVVFPLSVTQMGSVMEGSYTSDKIVANWAESSKKADDNVAKDVEVYLKKENRVSSAKQEAPLVVVDSDVSTLENLNHINPETIDSIEILKEPLYIINGIYYTEQEVFGPNPTSPYTPLDQQDIVSISVVKDEKAAALYGEKGKKGVVIISTKDGKPKAKSDRIRTINAEKNK